MVLSILSYNYDCCVISFLSIAVSGCFNFILYEYYSTVQVEYVTISGFISFPQLIFRLIERYCKFNEDWWYWVQFSCGCAGLVFNILYLIYLYCPKKNKNILIEKIKELDIDKIVNDEAQEKLIENNDIKNNK